MHLAPAHSLVTLALLSALFVPSLSAAGLALPVRAMQDATPPPPAATSAAPARPRAYYVRAGDTLGAIAERFGLTSKELVDANSLTNPDSLSIGQKLTIPGGTEDAAEDVAAQAEPQQASLVDRLPRRAAEAPQESPLYRTTWVTYYGRPEVPILGILGEYNLDGLIPILRQEARAYDVANGPDLGVTPALHLIYGMATARDGEDNSHMTYMEEELVRQYIDRAAWEGMGVILDVQIGNLSPLVSIRPAFPYLKYRNVQLALDPEFAMTTAGQTIPGQPPGMITADQINEVQAAIVAYMQEQGLTGHKMLIVHQFLPTMIQNKGAITELPEVDVVICADGFGAPWPKISKYNAFMTDEVQFAGFKLFYRWDEPIMTEAQAMGSEPFPGIGFMEKTPSLIIYQ